MATKIPIKGIIEINGKQVENTFQNISKEARSLERDLKKLVIGSDEYEKKSAELKNVNAYLTEHRNKLNETRKAAQDFNGEINNGSGIISQFKDRFVGNLQAIAAGEITFKNLGGVIKFFAAESWAAISSIPIIGWVVAATGAIGLAVREIIQYNNELLEANKLTSSVTKLQGDALDEVTLKSRAMEEALGFDRKDLLESAKALVNEYKITYVQALDEIEKGAIKGGRTNDEYLKSIREYPTHFANAGIAADEFIAIINAGYDLGIYADKLPDAIKELTLSVTQQTPPARAALVNAFGGPFANELLENINTGKITVMEGLTEIAKESDKYNLTQKQQAQLTADLFRGAGEDAGGFLKVMGALNKAAHDLNRPLTETEQILQDQIDKYNELETAKYEAMESDSVLALKREFDNLWKNLQIGYYNFIAWIRKADREFNASAVYMRGVFLSLPNAASTAFGGIIAALGEMVKGFGSGASSIAKFFKRDFDGAKAEADKFLNTLPNFHQKIKSITSNFASSLNTGGTSLANKYRKEYDAATKAKAEAERKLNAGKDGKKGNDFGGGGNNNDAARKEVEAARRKTEEEHRRYLEQIEKDEADSFKTLLSQLEQYQKDKTKLIEDDFLKAAQTEVDRRNIEERKNLTEIAELEKKKIETKSAVAKANYQKSIDLLHDIEIQNELAHRNNLRTLQEKEDAKMFELSAQRAQRNVEKMRQADEDEINSITSLAEAKRLLTEQSYLQLTDQELRAIDNLEDAKNALREAADRKALAAQRDAINAQIAVLRDALNDPALSEEARKKLLADLDEVSRRATQLTSAINGGTDQDAAKRVAENETKRGAVDLLGFSVQDWEDMYNNLETTEGKIQGVIMVMQALSNAAKMYSDYQRSLNQRELQQFTIIQDAKRNSLEKQLRDGYLSREEYNKETMRLEAELANKQAEINYKQAKAEKTANMMAAISGTAAAVVGALGNEPWTPLNFMLAGLVGALGAVQVGMIAAQPLPERPKFAMGGRTGLGFGMPDETGYRPAGIVHENEWVAPEWMTISPRYANVINWLENERVNGGRNFAEGGSATTSATNVTNTTTTLAMPADPEIKILLQKNAEFLDFLIENGVHIEESVQNGRRIQRMQKSWETIELKNKH